MCGRTWSVEQDKPATSQVALKNYNINQCINRCSELTALKCGVASSTSQRVANIALQYGMYRGGAMYTYMYRLCTVQ